VPGYAFRRRDYDGSRTCGQGRKTNEIKFPAEVYREGITTYGLMLHCKILTDDVTNAPTLASPQECLEQLSS